MSFKILIASVAILSQKQFSAPVKLIVAQVTKSQLMRHLYQ